MKYPETVAVLLIPVGIAAAISAFTGLLYGIGWLSCSFGFGNELLCDDVPGTMITGAVGVAGIVTAAIPAGMWIRSLVGAVKSDREEIIKTRLTESDRGLVSVVAAQGGELSRVAELRKSEGE